MKFNQLSNTDFDEAINTRDVLEKYLVYSKWFFLSVLIFGVLAFFKLLYEMPQYEVNASILIKEQEKGSSFTDLSSFEGLGLFGSGDKSLENEIQIIKSRRLMSKVVNELKLNIRYFIEDTPYNKEQYPSFPIIIDFKSDSSSVNKINTSFKILIKSNNKFEFIDFDKNFVGNKSFGEEFRANLGNKDMSNIHPISIDLNGNFKNDLIGKVILVTVGSVNGTVNNYLKKLTIEPINEKLSKVLTLSINESITQKGIAIINNLIEQYNADGINDKNLIAQTTTNFLDSRISLISAELIAIENTAEQFKTKKGMANVEVGTNIFLESSSSNESELIVANTQLELTDFMLEELIKSGNGQQPLPGNVGLSDPSAIGMITEYNNLILKRNRVLRSSSSKNPIIVAVDSQLNILRNNLRRSLNNQKVSLQIQINALNKQSSRISSRIASVPRNEREFKDIVRQQETKNALYLFLLQKREESIISNAVNVDKAKIIDEAYSNGEKVSPKKITTYLGSIILGLLIPFLIIYIKDLVDTKVHDENDINKLKIPYIGDIPLVSSKKKVFALEEDSSNIAEAFRYIRTNINFMLDRKDMGKTVFITSTQGKEGKTFTAINLAYSLAISGKKTLLLGMDLRAPKITRYLNIEDILGVTNYIKDNSLTVDDIIKKHTKFKNFHIINSGDIPPNPVELLMSKRVEEIFDYAKENYDYVIVDTAPVGLVTDTIQISKYANLTIYVVKANFLDKRMLHIPEKLHRENKLTNMAILINGSDHSKGAYGYGYGYGYGNEKKKPWYKKIF